jgi:hypothetical protein
VQGPSIYRKFVENSLNKSEKIRKNIFKNIDAIYDIAL